MNEGIAEAVDEADLRVAIFGATGLAGTGVLRAWLDDPSLVEARVITRRPLALNDPRVTEDVRKDFLDLDPVASALAGVDAVCFCLGISASQAKDRADYYRITHDMALAAGRATCAASPTATFHFISGSGTSRRSWMNWARVKAKTEDDLSALGLGGCFHYRPAMILPAAQPDRLTLVQRIGRAVAQPFASLPNVAVDNTAIGEAMIHSTRERRREGTLENRDTREAASRYRSSPAHSGLAHGASDEP